ncbi:uncharacterized protein LOC132639410 [Lycium barbarum]|uniref:uncharacterized protein LOC132639410 n=1 Tax=Lycium barbarum TaxID=112863 RepID=UPI00293F0FAE|nr:uncharacterized protein LOC132639410 [Lycium barbarum]
MGFFREPGNYNAPCLIGEDFNVIISEEEKYEGLPVTMNEWSRDTYGNIFQEIETLKDVVKVHEIQFELQPTLANRENLHKVQADLNMYLYLEEEFWKQKAGMQWSKDGDRITTFFHAYVQGRTKRLQLRRIQDQNDNWIESKEELSQEAIRFFSDQFTKEADPSDFEIIDHVPKMISEEQNRYSDGLPTEEKAKKVVFSLNGESAAGPDCFTGISYQTCWDIIKDDVTNMVKAFFCRAELPRFNIISLNQAGFVKGRSIMENVLLAQEIIADIRLRNKSANIVMKLDMAKAYDRVSWIFLLKVLRKFDFSEVLIDMIFRLISNNWYSVLINGQQQGLF